MHFEDASAEGTDIVDHHNYPHYLAGADLVDASSDPSIRESLASLHGFLDTAPGTTVTSQVFQITRN